MSTVEQRQQELSAMFQSISDWQDRYRKIIELGRELPELPEDLKQEKFRVRGCQSQVWLHASLDDDGRVVFRADSDAMIVRGLIAMVLQVYSGVAPAQILETPPRFIEEIGLAKHLSPTRSNGLRSLIEQIGYYAKAFQTLLVSRSAAQN